MTPSTFALMGTATGSAVMISRTISRFETVPPSVYNDDAAATRS
jgi:hypothetical protein